MNRRSAPLIGAISVAVLLLTGCGAATSDPRAIVLRAADEARAAGAEDNAAAMDDGEITSDEYYAAADRYEQCWAKEGLLIEGPTLSPIDNRGLVWSYPNEVPQTPGLSDRLTTCDSQWNPVVVAYLGTHRARMDDSLVAAVAECLEDQGFDISGTESSFLEFSGDRNKDGGRQFSAAEKCVISSAQMLFPTLPSIVITADP